MVWPRMAQNTKRRPANTGGIIATLGRSHAQGICFASEWFDLYNLLIQQHRPPIETDARGILRDVHELLGRSTEVSGRHDGTLDFRLRPAIKLHSDTERLIHPRLRLARA